MCAVLNQHRWRVRADVAAGVGLLYGLRAFLHWTTNKL